MEAEAEWERYFSSLTVELWLLLLLFVSDWLSWCVSYYYFFASLLFWSFPRCVISVYKMSGLCGKMEDGFPPGHLFHEAEGLIFFQLSSSPATHVPYNSTQQYTPLKCTKALKHTSRKCILHKSIFMSHSAYKGLSSVSHSSPSPQPAFKPSSEYHTYVTIL